MPMKTFIGYCLFLTLFFNSIFLKGQVPISPTIFGQNAWFINVNDFNVPTFSASFDAQLIEVKRSGVRFIRIGGIDVNFKPLYAWDPFFNFTTVDHRRLSNLGCAKSCCCG